MLKHTGEKLMPSTLTGERLMPNTLAGEKLMPKHTER